MYIDDNSDKIKTPLVMRITLFAAGILAGFLLMRAFITPYTVADDSMLPGLKKGNTVFVLKHFTPKAGKIALFSYPAGSDKVLLKRVAAAAGNTVEIVDRTILLNGSPAVFQWKTVSADNRVLPAPFARRDNMEPAALGEDDFFMLSDNLDAGFDSREFGPVKKKDIIGFIFLSL